MIRKRQSKLRSTHSRNWLRKTKRNNKKEIDDLFINLFFNRLLFGVLELLYLELGKTIQCFQSSYHLVNWNSALSYSLHEPRWVVLRHHNDTRRNHTRWRCSDILYHLELDQVDHDNALRMKRLLFLHLRKSGEWLPIPGWRAINDCTLWLL